MIITPFLCFSQETAKEPIVIKDKTGVIQSVEFPDSIKISDIPTSSDAFFKDFLKVSANDEFKKVPRKEKSKDFIHEHFDQYYKGIKVDNAGYNFHYKNGKMFYAHGHYVKINDLNVNPTISPEKARDCFANYKDIPLDSIADFISELIIKEISANGNDAVFLPMLVYRIYLYANHENNTEIGYIDAQNCKILLTEPDLIDFAATGTFTTRYSGTRQGITQNYSGTYHLADSTRGAIIHTWNLEGRTNWQSRIELSDNDNNWTAGEHSPSENDMGLDIHWAIQQIYDRLNNVYQINSFNDNGFPIHTHIHYGTTNGQRDNAYWSSSAHVLYFGDGAVVFRPVASLDVVAHEFGHGITDFQIGWGTSGDLNAFHEGLSDIWSVILENRIFPNSIWQIAEQITLNFACLRNLQNTNDPNALVPIANTFGSAQYNNSNDPYVRSGVFSHWFYLLVNGGSGINGIGNPYTVYGMGIDIAEDLIVEAVFNNYLDNTNTYAAIRNSMVNAARTLCSGQNSLLVNQVENAWYAVGVGTQPSQISLTGPEAVCYTGGTFTLNHFPAGCNSTWSFSSNMQSYNGGSNYIALRAISIGTGWIQPTVTSSCGSVILPIKNVVVDIQTPGPITIQMDAPPHRFTASISGVPCATSYNWYLDGVLQSTHADGAIFNRRPPYCGNYYYVQVEAVSALGKSAKRNKTVVEPSCDKGLLIIPNPASDIVEINIISDSTESLDFSASNISYSITITDLTGIKVYNTQKTTSVFTIPLYGIKEGIYIIIVTDNKSILQDLLIVEH